MGLTLIQKSDLKKNKKNAKLALVLAGGAITGGSYKVGGLKALDDFLKGRKVTDFDIYVGISAGGFLAVPLAGGTSPEEMMESLDGSSDRFDELSPLHFFTPNLEEFITRPLGYLYKLGQTLLSGKSLPSLAESVPSGLFDGKPLEQYLDTNLKRNRLPNNFKTLKRLSKKSLYIVATELDTGSRVTFGPDERNDVSISEAVQASCALPFIYKPVSLKGRDYIDGGICKTASLDIAIEKGADLIICYNPFRPYSNKLISETLSESSLPPQGLAQYGLFMILNQVFRTVYHTRLHDTMEHIKADRKFKGDVILIEPEEDDAIFFEMNPFSYHQRSEAAEHGYRSIHKALEAHRKPLSKILKSYGIETC